MQPNATQPPPPCVRVRLTTLANWGLLILCGLVFWGIGLMFAVSPLREFPEARAAVSWPVVPGRVLKASLKVTHHSGGWRMGGSSGVSYEATATYSYAFNGNAYTNSRVSFAASDGQVEKDVILQHCLRTDAPVDVHVNPSRPASSILFPVLDAGPLLLGGIALFAFGIVGGYILLIPFLFVPRRYRGFKTSSRGAVDDDPPHQQGVFRDLLLLPVASGVFVVIGSVTFLMARSLPLSVLAESGRSWLVLYPLAPLAVFAFALFRLKRFGRWVSVRRVGNEIVVTGLPPGKAPKFNGATASELPSTGNARRFLATNDNLTVFIPARGRRPALTWRGV